MGPIYMVHPEHGTHIAYDEEEVARCKENGWRLRDEPGLGALNATIEEVKIAPLAVKKRIGRPPKVKHGDRANAD